MQAEAVVNAGPANFISATGPNPLMVQVVQSFVCFDTSNLREVLSVSSTQLISILFQAVPFYPGASTGGSMGPMNTGHGDGEAPDAAATAATAAAAAAAAAVPRNIEIRIRTGNIAFLY